MAMSGAKAISSGGPLQPIILSMDVDDDLLASCSSRNCYSQLRLQGGISNMTCRITNSTCPLISPRPATRISYIPTMVCAEMNYLVIPKAIFIR